jgi:phospholipid/cholesterol/gamma-HCH transport system substrate-binding protein
LIDLRRTLSALAVLIVGALLGGCALLPQEMQPSGGSSYHVTAYFTKAVAFYPRSQVQVMGIRIGTVDSVTPQADGRVKVVASIDGDVPLPANVGAAIVPLSLLGERTLTFAPVWLAGQPKLPDGAVIQADRTRVPVEVDQALQAFTTLLQAFNPADADKLLHTGAEALSGNGRAFNRVLQQSADLTASIAGQDDQLIDVAKSLHRIAGVVDQRQKVLGTLISDFAKTSRALSVERQNVAVFLRALANLIKHGNVLIRDFQEQLVGDLGSIAQISLVFKGNAEQVATFLKALAPLGYMLGNGTNHKDHALTLRLALDNVLRSYLAAALKQPTVNPKVPCLPKPYSNCS